ncbi:MAG: bL28 family ribosomal protein [bacterium]|nr:bL28 family ribosomal protein [bacterium]
MAHCTVCGNTTQFGNTLSRSLQRTKRTMKPNLQKVGGLVLCTRCLRSLRKRIRDVAAKAVAA